MEGCEVVETVLKKPGVEQWDVGYYRSIHGDLETNGKKAMGHYMGKDKDDRDVVCIPDAPITRVEFNDRSQVSRTRKLGTTEDDVDPTFLAKRQRAVADAMVPNLSGHHMSGNIAEELLTLGKMPSQAAAFSSGAAVPAGAVRAVGHAGTGAGAGSGGIGAVGPATVNNDQASVPVARAAATWRRSGRAGAGAAPAAGAAGAASGAPAGGGSGSGVGSASALKARGRPWKDFGVRGDRPHLVGQ